jgi:hypothetical protein
MRDYSYRAMRGSPSLTTLQLAPTCGIMQLRLGDTIYTERLASFLESLGQATIVSGPNEIELLAPDSGKAGDMARREIAIYLRVWSVLYPDADVSTIDEGSEQTVEAQTVGAS